MVQLLVILLILFVIVLSLSIYFYIVEKSPPFIASILLLLAISLITQIVAIKSLPYDTTIYLIKPFFGFKHIINTVSLLQKIISRFISNELVTFLDLDNILTKLVPYILLLALLILLFLRENSFIKHALASYFMLAFLTDWIITALFGFGSHDFIFIGYSHNEAIVFDMKDILLNLFDGIWLLTIFKEQFKKRSAHKNVIV